MVARRFCKRFVRRFDRRIVSIVCDFFFLQRSHSFVDHLLHALLSRSGSISSSFSSVFSFSFSAPSRPEPFSIKWFVTLYAPACLLAQCILLHWSLLISISTVCSYLSFSLVRLGSYYILLAFRRPSCPASIPLPPGISLPLSPVSFLFLIYSVRLLFLTFLFLKFSDFLD